MQNRYYELRKKHERFIYHDFLISEGKISFHFSISGEPDIHFTPEWTFDLPLQGDIRLFAFNLGMAELVSYWKCACPPVVEIRCGILSARQISWWKKLYRNGLGEFFYRNGIEPGDDFMRIERPRSSQPNSPQNSTFFWADGIGSGGSPLEVTGNELPLPEKRELSGCLIPVGGGKDSIVTMELLKSHDSHGNNLCYIINPRRPVLETAYAAGFADDKIVKVNRTIDAALLRLNSLGYLNGHTPFSSVIAFSGLLFAYLAGKKHLVLSNESSANEANIAGTDINHQYSKSAVFEADFREYAQISFGQAPEYFSLLRPWSEWQITKKFTEHPRYLNVFQSCNIGSKTDTWCGKCAKCLYVYIMLAAFLSDDKLIPVFGANLLDSQELEPIFNGLVYENVDKPFECVGTRNEINLALDGAQKRRNHPEALPFLLRKYAENPVPSVSLDKYFDKNNYVPEDFLRLLK